MEMLNFINRIEDGSATTQPSSKHLTNGDSQMSTAIYWDVQSLNHIFDLPHTITQIEIFEEELDTKYVDSGELAPFYGKYHTEETKQKQSQSRLNNPQVLAESSKRLAEYNSTVKKGSTLTEDHKKKVGQSITGIKRSEETKQKHRDNWNNSPERKEKLAKQNIERNKARKGEKRVYREDGTFYMARPEEI